MSSRRDVLRLGARATAVGLTTGLAAGVTATTATGAVARTAGRPVQPPVDRDGPQHAAWQELETMLGPGAGLYRPGGKDYGRLAAPDNLRYAHVLPAAIVSCATVRDVQAAVRWAVKHGVPLTPRSGGHNYAGYSTTKGLLVHLRRMNRVEAPGRRRLVVEGGATNSDVYAARAANLYFPGGRCPGVGVAGLTLGGGLGFNDRKWGLTCDRMTETQIVLADGSLVRATERENAELFWACRGGAGGNFGINTGFVFDAVPVGDLTATVFDLTFNLKAGVKLMAVLQEIIEHDTSGDFDVRIGFTHSGTGPGAITVLGQRLGDEAELRRLLAGVLELKPSKKFIQQRGFWAAQDHLMAKSHPGAMASKSLVPSTRLEPKTVEAVVEWVRDWRPGTARNGGYVTLFAMGATSNGMAPWDTAFPHRDATFVVDIGAHWKAGTSARGVQDLLAQTRTIHHKLQRDLRTTAAYVNFPDPDLTGWHTAYYGDNYDRLTDVKRHADPTGVFRYAQAIGSATH